MIKTANKSLTFSAFTLAEVLITLGVIGIVAALVIPVLENYQKTQYVTALKKAYTTTNQALKQMSADYGCIDDLKCTGLFDSTTGSDSNFGDALIKYFKISKNCGIIGTVNEECWPKQTNPYIDGTYPTNYNYNTYSYYKFTTADGMSFAIRNYKNDCNTPTYSTGKTGNMLQVCGHLYVDINGSKKPNFHGRDTFYFWITNGKGALLYPYGGIDTNWNGTSTGDFWWNYPGRNGCSKDKKDAFYCPGRIIEKGWEMNY